MHFCTQSSKRRQQLRRLNVALLALSLSYIVAAALLLRFFGTVGLVVANCLNLLLRILYSLDYMANYFKSNLTYKFNIRSVEFRICLFHDMLLFLLLSQCATSAAA